MRCKLRYAMIMSEFERRWAAFFSPLGQSQASCVPPLQVFALSYANFPLAVAFLFIGQIREWYRSSHQARKQISVVSKCETIPLNAGNPHAFLPSSSPVPRALKYYKKDPFVVGLAAGNMPTDIPHIMAFLQLRQGSAAQPQTPASYTALTKRYSQA